MADSPTGRREPLTQHWLICTECARGYTYCRLPACKSIKPHEFGLCRTCGIHARR